MPTVTPHVTLLTHTPNPEHTVATAARLCYSPETIATVSDGMTNSAKLIRKLKQSGHLSPFEHASFTFGLEGVSRALLCQITRHRIASFSVQSQRYVTQNGKDGFAYLIPPTIKALGEEAQRTYDAQMEQINDWYAVWRKLGVPGEDARFVLPNAAATRIIVTMNARELMHFFELRCCNRAQWEIRSIAWQMLALVTAAAPALFENCGPSCVTGNCPEGTKSCGRSADMRAKATSMRREVLNQPNIKEEMLCD